MPARRKPLLTAEELAFVKDASPPAPAPKGKPQALPLEQQDKLVRFTVDLPRSLHRRLKIAAAEDGRPMTQLAREVLEQWLEAQA